MSQTNVFGEPIEECCSNPITGYFRDGFCRTDKYDRGSHTVCAEITDEFLEFSKSRGNDLSTPRPEYGFAGLRPGDRWCLCASRWQEAYEAGMAPAVILEATHMGTLEWADLDALKEHAVRHPGAG